MKKVLLIIPLALISLHFMYQSSGPNIWTQSLTASGQIWAIVTNPTNQSIMYAGSNTTGVWKTTNSGVNWAQVNSGLTNLTVQALGIGAANPNVVYAGTSSTGGGNGMYKSTDAGATWTLINTGITQTPIAIQSISVSQTNSNNVCIAIWDGLEPNATVGLFRTTDGGTTWSASSTGMGANKNTLCVARNPSNPNTVYCGTSFLYPNPPGTGPTFVYKSYDGGATWTSMSTGLPTTATDINPVRQISVSTADTSVVLVGLFYNTITMNGGIYLSTNGGTSWVQRSTGLPNAMGTLPRTCLIRPGSTMEFYVGIDGGGVNTRGVFRTVNGGVSWTDFNGGVMLNTFSVRVLGFRTAADSTVYAGVSLPVGNVGVYEYSWPPVGINDPNSNLPKEFSLSQNYPNPFNPNTVISFGIPKSSFVTMKVYDISGKELLTLVNEQKSAGTYNISFNAADLPSGVYFYKIITGDFTDSKKMILIK